VLAILAPIAKQERVRRSERVLALRAKGLSLRAIAAETWVSFVTVQRIVQAARSVRRDWRGWREQFYRDGARGQTHVLLHSCSGNI
jgi:hypothetical protein